MKKQMTQVQSQLSDEKTRNNNLMSTVTQLDRASQEMKKKMDQVQSQLSEEKTRNDNLMSTVTKLQSSFDREMAKTVNLEAVTSQMSASIQRGNHGSDLNVLITRDLLPNYIFPRKFQHHFL